eukprot:3884305-Amphidinium_carterae.1
MAGHVKHSEKGTYEDYTAPAGKSEHLAGLIREVGGISMRQSDTVLVHGKFCNLILFWMLNKLVDNDDNGKMTSRDEMYLQTMSDKGIERLCEAMVDMDYKLISVVIGGDDTMGLTTNPKEVPREERSLHHRIWTLHEEPAALLQQVSWHLPRNKDVKTTVHAGVHRERGSVAEPLQLLNLQQRKAARCSSATRSRGPRRD